MSSDRGPHFIAKIIMELAKMLNITWGPHTPYRPQASGKVERINCTLKMQMSKLCRKTSMDWTQVLPLALLRIRIPPRGRQRLSP